MILFLLSGCKNKIERDTKYFCKNHNLNCIKENTIVTFTTSKGDFDVELFGSSNPLTVSNFIKNISENIYENTKFYKLIEYPNTKIIHGGIKNNQFSFNNKMISAIPLEIQLTTKKEPLYEKEIIDPREFKFLKNNFKKGSISMAKISKTKSSSTEFFISTQKSTVLEGRYAVFGRVINGFEILEKININDFILEIVVND